MVLMPDSYTEYGSCVIQTFLTQRVSSFAVLEMTPLDIILVMRMGTKFVIMDGLG